MSSFLSGYPLHVHDVLKSVGVEGLELAEDFPESVVLEFPNKQSSYQIVVPKKSWGTISLIKDRDLWARMEFDSLNDLIHHLMEYT